MSKLERDTLENLAKKLNTSEQFRVVLPDLPKIRPLAEDIEQRWKEDWDEWHRQVVERKVDALYELAKARDADVNELAKVEDILLQLVPPDMRGKKGVDYYPKFLLVALEMRKGKSQRLACELAGIDTKTFRKLTDKHDLEWRMVQTFSAKLPEFEIRKIAEERKGE